MRAAQAAPYPGKTVVVPIGLTVKVIPRGTIHRGVRYRVVSTQDCWFTVDGDNPALPDGVTDVTLNWSVYLPAKTPDFFIFAMADPTPDGFDPEIRVIGAAAGTIYFTPVRLLPAE